MRWLFCNLLKKLQEPPMPTRTYLLGISTLLAVSMLHLVPSAQGQQATPSQPTSQPTTRPEGRSFARGGGARATGPTITEDQRQNWIGLTSTNSYTPIDTLDDKGNVIHHDSVHVVPIPDELRESY